MDKKKVLFFIVAIVPVIVAVFAISFVLKNYVKEREFAKLVAKEEAYWAENEKRVKEYMNSDPEIARIVQMGGSMAEFAVLQNYLIEYCELITAKDYVSAYSHIDTSVIDAMGYDFTQDDFVVYMEDILQDKGATDTSEYCVVISYYTEVSDYYILTVVSSVKDGDYYNGHCAEEYTVTIQEDGSFKLLPFNVKDSSIKLAKYKKGNNDSDNPNYTGVPGLYWK